jgi:hypothetical protein
MVELVDRDQPVVESLHPELVDGEAERGMGAHQYLVVALQERADGLDLSAVVRTRRIAQIPLRLDPPVGPEAILCERLVIKACADRLLRHHNDGLFEALIVQLVERDEHQRPAFAGGRR